MEAVFLKILNMSITASWLVLAVIVSRFLLKKAPKAFSVILWGLVGIRLILPFSLESVLSLVPSAETVPGDIVYSAAPEINSGIAFLNSAVNPLISETLAPNEISSANPMQIITIIASAVWVVGIAAMLLYTVVSFLRFRSKVREAAPFNENIYLCDGIGTPFILGVIRPRIYLPSDIGKADMEYVIAHERAHLKRRDHLWKPLGFLLLAVYWFNPVLWIAYILLCRDIELACDEKVIRDRGVEIKKSYSEALVNCSVPRKMIAACPLAFGEGSVKGRIKSVLNYKKPAFWIIIVGVIACVAVSVCFLTNPTGESEIPENFIATYSGSETEGIFLSVKKVELDTEEPYIEIELKNETEYSVYCTGEYDIQYYDESKGKFTSCAKSEPTFGDEWYESRQKFTKKYGLKEFDLTKEGRYRFITVVDWGELSRTPWLNTWIDFEIVSSAESEKINFLTVDEIAKLINTDSSLIDSLGSPAYGVVEGKSTAVIPVGVKINDIEESASHDSYIIIVTEASAVYHQVDRSYLNDKVYLNDIDGDGSDEIIVHQLTSAAGGAGGYNALIYKIENGILSAIFNSEGGNQFDTGFSSKFTDGYKLEINNNFTDYKTVLDLNNSKKHKEWFFNEDGSVLSEYKDKSWIMVDSFNQFIPKDVDNDGIYEISCVQYASLRDHSDYIGDCKTVLKYDNIIGDFVVADAEFVPFESK